MSWITVATPPFTDLATFDAVVDAAGGNPAGMEARYVGRAPDGTLRIVTLWESKADAERFFGDTLGPALAKVLGPEPVGPAQIVEIDVVSTYARQAVG